MNILCVIDTLGAGGAQRQIVELAKGFVRRGHDVEFLTYYPIPFFNSVLESEGIHIFCIEESNYLMRLLKMRRFIRGRKYDAVLSFLEGANFICQVAGFPTRKWKLVVGERSANPEILKSLKLIVFRWFHFFADYIVANSNANMKYVKAVNPMLANEKCQVVYNIVDFDEFKPLEILRQTGEDKFHLVIPARIRPEKNITGLIQALLLLSNEERQKLQVDWYGKYEKEELNNPLLKESLELIQSKGLDKVITFFEATLDIKSIIQYSDAVGLFSTFEGFPNAICEAMACAKPVVCSKVSDMDFFLSHEPHLLCDPYNPTSIKDSLSYLINMDQKSLKHLGIANRNIALREFEKESIVSRYLDLLGVENN